MIKKSLRDTQFILAIKIILFVLANKKFMDFKVKIMLKNEFKAKMIFFLHDSIFLFTYNMKIIILNQFSNLGFFDINNFQADINVVIKYKFYPRILSQKNQMNIFTDTHSS